MSRLFIRRANQIPTYLNTSYFNTYVTRLVGIKIADTTPHCIRMINTALNYKNIPDHENTSGTTRHKRSIKQSKRKRKRFIQMPKSSTTEDELAHHVQTVFSGDLEEMLVDPDCDDMEGNVDMIKRLERHPALVLNADYQVQVTTLKV